MMHLRTTGGVHHGYDTNVRNVRMIQSVTGVSFSVELHRSPALELCSMCGKT